MVFDDKPLTDALLGPGYRIPVLPSGALCTTRSRTSSVILAWRYAGPIMSKHKRFTDGGGRFAVPWPDFAIHEAAA